VFDSKTRQALGYLAAAVREMENRVMSGLTDLQAAVTAEGASLDALETEQATFLRDITAALSTGDSDAAVEAAAQVVTAYQARLQALAAGQAAADPAAAAPVPPTAQTAVTS
jgi:DNA-binding FadR family transcriptional regulator